MLTRHETQQLQYLKARMTTYVNLPLYHTTQLVIYRGDPAFIQEHDNSNEHPELHQYTITYGGGLRRKVDEIELRPVSLKEFFWYKDPQDGARKVGNNDHIGLWAFGEAVLIAGTIAFAKLGGDDAQAQAIGWLFPILTLAVPVVIVVETIRQFKGLQK